MEHYQYLPTGYYSSRLNGSIRPMTLVFRFDFDWDDRRVIKLIIRLFCYIIILNRPMEE